MALVLFYNRFFPLQEKDHVDLFFNRYWQSQGFMFLKVKSAVRGKSSAIRYSSQTNRKINIYNLKAIRWNAKLHIRLIGPILHRERILLRFEIYLSLHIYIDYFSENIQGVLQLTHSQKCKKVRGMSSYLPSSYFLVLFRYISYNIQVVRAKFSSPISTCKLEELLRVKPGTEVLWCFKLCHFCIILIKPCNRISDCTINIILA